MTDVVKVLRWELYKLARQRASYLGFVLSLVFTIVMLIGFGMSDFKVLRNMKALGFDPMTLINGPFFANFTLNIGFFAVLPLLAATLGGSQIAGEAKDGSLRALMLRPPSRTTIYFAKVIATWIWLQLNVFFMVALALLVGTVAFGGGDLLVFVWEFRKAGPWIVDAHWAMTMLAVSLGAGASLFVISALSLFLTTVTDSPVVAHVGTLGGFFISSVIQRLPDQLISDDVRDALPTKHMNFWHELYRLWHPASGQFNAPRFWEDVAWCGGFIVVFLGAGLWWLRRKDVTA